MGVIVLSVLALGYTVNPMIITVFVAIIAPIATYELIHNVAKIKSKILSVKYNAVKIPSSVILIFQKSSNTSPVFV